MFLAEPNQAARLSCVRPAADRACARRGAAYSANRQKTQALKYELTVHLVSSADLAQLCVPFEERNTSCSNIPIPISRVHRCRSRRPPQPIPPQPEPDDDDDDNDDEGDDGQGHA